MAVLKCDCCPSMVETPYCCGFPMDVRGQSLECATCRKTVSANRCCGELMHAISMDDVHRIKAERATGTWKDVKGPMNTKKPSAKKGPKKTKAKKQKPAKKKKK